MASKNLRLRDDDDITVEDFTAYYDANVTAYPGQINTNLVDWREKTQEETIEYVVPNDLDSNLCQNPEDIYDDDHEDTVHLELATSQALQHLDELLEFSIAKNDEALSQLLSEVINMVENIKILSLRQSSLPGFFKEF